MTWRLLLLCYALATSASVDAVALDHVEVENAQQIKFELQITDESLLTVRAMLPPEQRHAMAGPLPIDRTQPTKVYLDGYLPIEFIKFRNQLYLLASQQPGDSLVLLDMVPALDEPDFLHKLCLWILPAIGVASAANALYGYTESHTSQMTAQAFNCLVNVAGYGVLYVLSAPRYRAWISPPKIVADNRGRPLTVSEIKRDANRDVADVELLSESAEEYRLSDISIYQRAPLDCEFHLRSEFP